MANTDVLKRFLDAGVSFTQMTRERAEAVVRELVQLGAVRVEETQQAVQELVDRGRETSERLTELISAEVRKQVEAMTSRVDGLEARVDDVARGLGLRGGRAPAKTSTAKKSAAKKSAAKKTAAKKTTAKKTAAKKTTAKKTAAKKTTAKKSAAKKSAARTSTTKRAAKKAAG